MSARDELEELVSAISEEACCAGWAPAIEFDLWDCVSSDRRQVGQITLGEERVTRLRELGESVGGWIVFPGWEGEPSVVTKDYWQAVFAHWKCGERDSEILADVARHLSDL